MIEPIPRSLAPINQMDLATVQAERSRIEIRQRELEAEIQRLSRLRLQNPPSDQRSRYNNELRQYADEQERLQERDERLEERAAMLQPQARQTGGSGPAIAFVYGSLLAVGVMYALTRAINLTLDLRAIGVAALIAVAAGFLTFLIALFL